MTGYGTARHPGRFVERKCGGVIFRLEQTSRQHGGILRHVWHYGVTGIAQEHQVAFTPDAAADADRLGNVSYFG
jgi:hypothetical protein